MDLFMIDPPWPQTKGGRRSIRPNQGSALDYATLDWRDLWDLLDKDIFSIAAVQHTVFLWTIDKYLLQTHEEMLARQYKLHARIIWNKTNGVAPAFTLRFSHEYLLWFYKPTLIPIAKEQRGKFTTVLTEKARQHSRKPDAAYALVEALYPSLCKLDVFSREKRAGWEQYGDQTDAF